MSFAERKHNLARLIRYYRNTVEHNTTTKNNNTDGHTQRRADQSIKDARRRLAALRLEFYYVCQICKDNGSDHVST